MKKRIIYLSLLLGVTTVTLISCGDSNANSETQAQPKATPMAVSTIPNKTVTSYLTYPTTIEGKVNSEVRAKFFLYIQYLLLLVFKLQLLHILYIFLSFLFSTINKIFLQFLQEHSWFNNSDFCNDKVNVFSRKLVSILPINIPLVGILLKSFSI